MTDVRDRLIADAKSASDLRAKAQTQDPELYKQLTAKPLLASKTIWGSLITMALTWAVTRYGIALSPDTCALISGAVVLAATAALRYITAGPISGLISAHHG